MAKYLDKKILKNWRRIVKTPAFADLVGLFDAKPATRRSSLRKLLSLSSRESSPAERDWLSFATACVLVSEVLPPTQIDKFECIEAFEFLAKAYGNASLEENFLRRRNPAIFRSNSRILESLHEVKKVTGRARIYLPLLDSKKVEVRCLGSYCLSRLSPQEELQESISKSLKREEEPRVRAGLLWWAGKWKFERATCCEFLDSEDKWIQRAAAYSVYEAGFDQDIELTKRVLELLDDVMAAPEDWSIPAWGEPDFRDALGVRF